MAGGGIASIGTGNIIGGETFEFEFGKSGIVQPGSYELDFDVSLLIQGEQSNSPIPGSFANGTGQFEFSLDRLNHIPDTGSTLAFLSIGLIALGLIRSRPITP